MTSTNHNDCGPQLLQLGLNMKGRDYAVGDIHGCFSALESALEAIGFLPDVDRLICAGDLVDRGPESSSVLSWLDKPWFFSAMGNHDFMGFEFALDGPEAALAAVNLRNHGGEWLLDLPKDQQMAYGNRLRALPLAIEVETWGGPVGIVHADFPSDDWHAIRAPFSGHDRQTCLWSTMRYERMYTAPVRNVRALIHGHLTLSKAQKIANVFFIDTGGWRAGEGHFTFVELASLQVIQGPGTKSRG